MMFIVETDHDIQQVTQCYSNNSYVISYFASNTCLPVKQDQ